VKPTHHQTTVKMKVKEKKRAYRRENREGDHENERKLRLQFIEVWSDGKLEGERYKGSHKSSSTTLRIYLLESLFLLSLVDNAKSGHEEAQKDGHESVDSREDWIQSIIGPLRYGSNTEGLRLGDKIGISTECSTHLNKICSVEVTTALEHILYCNPSTGSLFRPARVEVVSYAESKEPDD